MCTNGRNFYNSSTVVGKRVYENLNSNLLEMRLLLTALCVNVIDDGVPVCKLVCQWSLESLESGASLDLDLFLGKSVRLVFAAFLVTYGER
jgi:hypothetical protein